MQQRPFSVSVLGILNIVFGFYALFGVFGNSALLSSTDDTNPLLKVMHEHPAYATWVKCSLLLGILSLVLLLVSGIGLLRLREWARKLSIAYGIYAILVDVALSVMNFKFVFPSAFAPVAQSANAANLTSRSAAASIMVGVFGLIYPVALIALMTRPKIAAAFRSEEKPPILPTE